MGVLPPITPAAVAAADANADAKADAKAHHAHAYSQPARELGEDVGRRGAKEGEVVKLRPVKKIHDEHSSKGFVRSQTTHVQFWVNFCSLPRQYE